ncbi:hypothetical protein BCV69DRAFT_304880 [Microstroma glucosiphilum]|uniref:Uncharacterized protein n=1 Tax=Pseudomicrostroma glucosiphilum TaxID=1684307 RepID=A0A316TYE6_9BASI|nr:hypothetical protein BCV69DRAFT_304880 [Pseudomicrostroma glucosiphilum]PWN18252.1 hypothetical protein BCV69DRAFT_304880 [Pseudomicrostroma glucosiphilum]
MERGDTSASGWKTFEKSSHWDGQETPNHLSGVPVLEGELPLDSQNGEDGLRGASFFRRTLRRCGKARSKSSSRLHFLDGLRLVAALALLTSTVITSASTGWKGSQSVLYPFRSDWGITLFMTLLGRVFGLPWLHPIASSSNGQTPATANYHQLGQAMLRRIFRFLLPIVVVSAVQYRTCRSTNNLYPDNVGFTALIGGTENKPQWCAIDNQGWASRTTALFVENSMSLNLRQRASLLYAAPWLLQGSFYALGATLLSHVFKTNFRTTIWLLLAFFNWVTYSYLTPVMMGILLADFSASGYLERITLPGGSRHFKMGPVSLTIALLSQLGLLGLFIMLTFIPIIRENVSDGLAHLQLLDGSVSNTLTSGFELVRFSDVISAFLLLILAEVASPFRWTLTFAPIALMGRWLAPGLVILSPLAFFGIVPNFYLPSADYVASSAHGALASAWGYTFACSVALAVVFLVLIDLPSRLFGKAFVWALLPTPQVIVQPPSPHSTDAVIVAAEKCAVQHTSWHSFSTGLLSKSGQSFRSLYVKM